MIYDCLLDRVIDGDTIVVDIHLGFDIWMKGQHIRINGIDTPESRTSDKIEQMFGILSKERVIELLTVKREHKILIDPHNDRDKYGRILGDIILSDTETLSSILIKEHLAVHYGGKSKSDIYDEHMFNRKWLKKNSAIDNIIE